MLSSKPFCAFGQCRDKCVLILMPGISGTNYPNLLNPDVPESIDPFGKEFKIQVEPKVFAD